MKMESDGDTYFEEAFPTAFDRTAKRVFRTSREKGFESGAESTEHAAMKIALMHSELSEALEALRKGVTPDPHCPHFSNLEVELADTVIRIMDFAVARNLNVGGAIYHKIRFNETRPHKHGKGF